MNRNIRLLTISPIIAPIYLFFCLADILIVMPIIFFIIYPIQTVSDLIHWAKDGYYDCGFDIRQDYFLTTRLVFHKKQLMKYYDNE